MKKNISIILTLLAVLIFSCKKENNEKIASLPASKTVATQEVPAVPSAHFYVIAGKLNTSGNANGSKAKARFNQPKGICVALDGSLLIADHNNKAVRKITHDTVVTTLHLPATPAESAFTGATPYDVAETKNGAIGIVGYIEYDNGFGGTYNYYGLWVLNPHGQLSANFIYDHEGVGEFGGIDKDFGRNVFWYTGGMGVDTVTTNGYLINDIANPDADLYHFGAVSSCSNGVKYFTDGQRLYKLTKGGVQAQIYTSLTFTNITSIRANTGGTKLYIVDNGNIKMINNCSGCAASATTILSGQAVSNIALANSEKYIYFTSALHNTVNKLTL